ncbi:sigma-70 family RNA polymerase sigma factor [Leptobacterium flavescens]|uniref:Sigma-70 family RNA polymerase sigma factor n=1 Tax=Leptobacterium flavescens TaxID=472055 RepID=A0A6P0URR9_9FLAO|nr:sigma-70 family RNA polymerase sigma factor [Leptobacterium flavescens]NER15210.1 sigma-70 family RNA polymerase sigma factor [Leptobacterium flavescens]
MSKEDEFAQVIKDNEGVIFKITTFYTNNEDDQKDLYQDIVYQLWKSYDKFRGEAKISTWMYRIALNTAITHLKKEKRKGNRVSIDKVVLKQTEYYDTTFEERLKALYAHIKKLNALEKGLILLLLEGKKYEEIAVITGLSASNVGTRLSRIKQKLKSQITEKTSV